VNIVIRSQGVPISQALHAHCRERVERVLRPFAPQVAEVGLVLVDLNGPRRSPAQTCRLSVELTSGDRVRFASSARDYYQAAGRAATGAGRHVTRLIQRRRMHVHERFTPLDAA
jgi:ribosomal subunit interface protein